MSSTYARLCSHTPRPTTLSDPQDVPGLGRDGEVLEVKPGRARNHLVPARVAVYATPDRLPEAAERRAAWADESAIAEQADEDGDVAVRLTSNVFSFSTDGLEIFARKEKPDAEDRARREALSFSPSRSVRDGVLRFLSLRRVFRLVFRRAALFATRRPRNERTR